MTAAVASLAAVFAALPAVLIVRNLWLYRPPPPLSRGGPRAGVSVLIPARNEEENIAAALDGVLASTGVDLEVIVLDDASEDATAAIVRAYAQRDDRVRLEVAPPLPPGWCGKQHACWVLAQQARGSWLVFVDADVRLAPEALARSVALLQENHSQLASGVPRQVTGTLMEHLLIPLIHWVLLGFLPLDRMRRSTSPAYGAGCGQFFVADRQAYLAAGGHRAIAASRHDGLMLPRIFRQAGYRTDLFDLTDLATCRMYRSGGEVWKGLLKNAGEGMGSPRLIVPFTVMLLLGQVLPLFVVALAPRSVAGWSGVALGFLGRALLARRFRQSWLSVVLHPVGIVLLVAIQWHALLRSWRGERESWRGRAVVST